MNRSFAGVVLSTSSILVLLCNGCATEDQEIGTMQLQDDTTVQVHRDASATQYFGLGYVGDPYYLDNGARVYLNQTSSEDTMNRPTNWNQNPESR